MAAPKIIVFGSLNGQLKLACQKVAALHAKNDFAFAILTGDVFAPDGDPQLVADVLNGLVHVPIPTYFTVGLHPLPPAVVQRLEANESLCENLHFLGKRSITTTAEGIRIVVLAGGLDSNLDSDQASLQYLPQHSLQDATALRGANSADILLTSIWPAGIWQGSKVCLEPQQQAVLLSSPSLAELCAALKPRYHLSASPGPFFYEREPFVHPASSDSDAVESFTRFISMAPLGNNAKAKAMYAFSLNKSDSSIPAGITRSPFAATHPLKRDRNGDSAPYSRFGGHHGDGPDGRSRKRHRRLDVPGPDRCNFCLANPDVSEHMVCSIGMDSYLTTAKGPLLESTTFSDRGLDFPAHFIITPQAHAATVASMGSLSDASSEATRTFKEMDRFREALQAMIAAKSSFRLGAVTWEISRHRNIHLIWQLVAVPAELIQKGMMEAAFRVEAENNQLPAFLTKDLALEEQADFGDFFRLWLWADNGEDRIKGKSLVMPLSHKMQFDWQFGRRVLAKLLGLENRLAWQNCEQDVEQETKHVEAFRNAFADWDFTLQDDQKPDMP